MVPDARAEELKKESRDWPSWDLTERQICDLELLLNGAFSPLQGFMNRDDYDGVCSKMRLADGTLWPLPVTLDVSEELAKGLSKGAKLGLRDAEGVMIAVLTVGDVWELDRKAESERRSSAPRTRSTPQWRTRWIRVTHGRSGARWRAAAPLPTTTSSVSGSLRRSSGADLPSWDGERWWRSRPATRCIAPTSS